MIGLSVSFCIADIVEGRVRLEDVEKIVSGMKCATTRQFGDAIRHYRDEYWSKDPGRGEDIAWELYLSGRIIQPRLSGGKPPQLLVAGNWVESENEIVWMEDWRELGD